MIPSLRCLRKAFIWDAQLFMERNGFLTSGSLGDRLPSSHSQSVVWIFILYLYWKAKLVFHSSSSVLSFHLTIFRRKTWLSKPKTKAKTRSSDDIQKKTWLSKPKTRAKTWSMIGDHLMIFIRKPDGQMQSEHFCWKVFYASHLFIKYMKLML